MTKVSKEVATDEINKWLDSKKVFAGKREAYKDHIDIMIEAISEGCLTILEDGSIKQTLLFELNGGEGMAVKELQYKPRLNRKMVIPHLTNVKAGDGDGRVLATMAALTGQPKNILSSLDNEDSRIADSIVVFFVS